MKRSLVFRGPVLTASGYGVHARQVLSALVACGNFDISVRPTKWGDTPFLHEKNPQLDFIRSLCFKGEDEERQGKKYDVSVQVTIPNEFQKLARLNIGVTAGIEVDRVAPEWILKTNDVINLVVVPSIHSANTFARITYEDKEGNQLKLNRELIVSPEGVDTSHFNPHRIHVSESEIPPFMERLDRELKSDFNFLVVGLGLDRGMGEDRKNISTTIKWFCEAFRGNRDVGLVLKIAIVGSSLIDFEACKRRVEDIKHSTGCGEFPRIHLIHGRLTDAEMAILYKHEKIKALVTLTHGEGFGLPVLEAAACGLPILATDWSGHLDFLSIDGKKRFVPFAHDLKEIPQSAVWENVMSKGTRWAYPREEDVKLKMKKIVLSYDRPKEWATELASHIEKKYSLEFTAANLSREISEFVDRTISSTDMKGFVAGVKKRLDIGDEDKTLIFTMPMSAGDVYIATGVISALRSKFSGYKIFFATSEPYRSILEGNPDIDFVIKFDEWMMNVPLLEQIFIEVYTPNIAIQHVGSNWVHGGKGRLLGDEMAAQCHVEYDAPKIELETIDLPEGPYICFNPTSGKGQWEARNYIHWQEVVNNLVDAGVTVVQVGLVGDPLYKGVVDYRGRTNNFKQLAYVIKGAVLMLGVDTVTMHLACGLEVPYVSLFGSSYPTSTGPVNNKKTLNVLMETPNRYTCDKACYKHQCAVDREHPCINEIAPKLVMTHTLSLARKGLGWSTEKVDDVLCEYKEYLPKISGYTHILNPDSQGLPYVESIRSMLGFCDEVVVVDGGSTDGSLKRIETEIADSRVKVYTREWDWSEPGMDGQQKAFGRANCTGDFLWQQDADEVVHEEDYEKIRKLVKRFPSSTNLLALPVVELWGGSKFVRTDRHSWKWRLSRNDFRITHGINKDARVYDEKTGKTYAKKGMSDGCEYVDIMTGEFIPHKNFYTQEHEALRRSDSDAYGVAMNDIFEKMPCVFHYSWSNIPRKIRHFVNFWDRCWGNLYHEEKPEQRFFSGRDPKTVTREEILQVAGEVDQRGGEHGKAKTFELRRSNPGMMQGWIDRIPGEYGNASG